MTVDMVIDTNVSVEMRDGTALATDIYRPATQSVPVPALVQRTPYDKSDRFIVGLMVAPEMAVGRGYAVVVQDTRGRYKSPGDPTPFKHEASDGYDTIEWVARQPWCDGHVGIYGRSAVGITAVQAAAATPPHLRAAHVWIAPINPREGFVYADGAFQVGNMWHFCRALVSDNFLNRLDAPEEERAAIRAEIEGALEQRWETIKYLPLSDMPGVGTRHTAFWREWLEHPANDSYWDALDPTRPGAIRVPVLHMAGWYEVLLRGHIDLQRVLQSSARANEHRFIAGPWTHGGHVHGNTGQRQFGASAVIGSDAFPDPFFPWFDKWLKAGDGHGLPASPVRYFMMGVNEWLDARQWPPPSRARRLYLSGGHANTRHGGGTLIWERSTEASVDTFTYDPRDPVPSVGGRTMHVEWLPPGIHDQREVELRSDVLVYTSPPLEDPLAIAGSVHVSLYASTSAEDTDFTGKLVDVEPEGFCANLGEGLVRARYRNGGGAAETWVVPHRIEQYDIDLGDVAHSFLASHRVRLEISSSNFPHYNRNLNSRTSPERGGPSDIRDAHQQVSHGGDTPSSLVLPVIADDTAQP